MFSISHESLERIDLKGMMSNSRAGALVCFEGKVRNHNEGQEVVSLEYECFEELARKEGKKIITRAQEKFDILEARCIHRIGKLNISEIAVWVGVLAEHRYEAFRGCEYIIDQVKLVVPIWKKEYYSNGDSDWVNCHRCSFEIKKKF